MAYTPRSFENKPGVSFDPDKTTVLFAEDINYIFGLLASLPYLAPYPTRVSLNASGLTLSSGTYYDIPFENVEFDDSGAYDSGSYTYTAPESGYYHFDLSFLCQVNTISSVVTFLMLVNSSSVLETYDVLTSLNRCQVARSGVFYLNAGDVVSFQVTTNSATGGYVFNIPKYTYFSCHRVS